MHGYSSRIRQPQQGTGGVFVTHEDPQEECMRKTFWYIVGGQLATIASPALAQDASAETLPSENWHGRTGEKNDFPEGQSAQQGATADTAPYVNP